MCMHCGQREGMGEAGVRSTRQFGKYYLNTEESFILFSPPSSEYLVTRGFQDCKLCGCWVYVFPLCPGNYICTQFFLLYPYVKCGG